MEKQIACILGPDSGCDEVGLKAKRIGRLVLSDHCPRPMCDECTKKAIRMVVGNAETLPRPVAPDTGEARVPARKQRSPIDRYLL